MLLRTALWGNMRRWALAGGASLVLAVVALNVALGVSTKAPCFGSWHDGLQPRYCYSDVVALFGERRLGMHIFPYVHGRYAVSSTGNAFLSPGEIEYPVLTGLFVWLAALPVHSAEGFLVTNELMLAPFGVVSAWLLWRMVGRRALAFAAAPSVAFYAFLNWDLLGVACAVGAIYLWSRRQPCAASVAFAVGGCFKVWPAFFVLPLVLEVMASGKRRLAWRVGGAGAGVALAANLPFMVVNWRGWYAPLAFQADWAGGRSTNSLWYWEARGLSTHAVDVLSSVAVAAGFVVIGWLGWRRAKRGLPFPFLQSGAAMVCWYVVAGKVYSPQYDLWLVPLFVLLGVRGRLWAQFVVVDAAIYAWWLVGITGLSGVMYAIVLWRTAVVVAAMVGMWRAEAAVGAVSPAAQWSRVKTGQLEALRA